MEYEIDGDTDFNWRTRYSHQIIDKGFGRLENKRTNRDHPNYSIIKISRVESWRLEEIVVTQTPVRSHLLTLMWKTLKVMIIIIIAQPSTCPRKWHTQTPMGLWYTNGSPNLDQKTRPYNNQQKKKICKIVDFPVPADRIRLKECEKKDKYLDLARELKKLWNMKVTIVPIVIGAFGTVTKGLLTGLDNLEVGGRVETIQTTALLKTARILRRVLETWEDLLSLNLRWKIISLCWCEKF